MRDLLLALLLASTLALTGCYAIMGVDHNRTAVVRLKVGMSRQESLVALDEGGSITFGEDLLLTSKAERDTALNNQRVLDALQHAELETGRLAVRALRVTRRWGFMGSGIVHLFLDDRGKLVGYHLFHIN